MWVRCGASCIFGLQINLGKSALPSVLDTVFHKNGVIEVMKERLKFFFVDFHFFLSVLHDKQRSITYKLRTIYAG